MEFRSSGGALDADEAPTSVLTLEQAVRQALRHDPEIQATIAHLYSAWADARQARMWPNPVLNIAFRIPEGGGKAIIDAGLSADLLAILQRPRRVSAADSRLRAASAEALSTVLDLLSSVQEHYAAIQALEAEMEVLRQRSDLILKLLDLARARLNKGEGTQLDVTTLEAQEVELGTEIAERQLERREERLILTRLIGQPSRSTEWEVTKWESPTRITSAEADWIAAADRHRPEVQARRWELAALGDELAMARFSVFEGIEVGVESERDDGWSVGPSTSIPLPLLDTGSARRDKARAEVIEARHNLMKTRRQVVEEVRRAYASFASTEATLAQVESRLIPLQERRRRQAEAAYLAGQTDITALLIAEQDLQASRTKLVELQRKTSETFIRLQRAVGGAGVASALVGLQSTTQPATRPASSQPAEQR